MSSLAGPAQSTRRPAWAGLLLTLVLHAVLFWWLLQPAARPPAARDLPRLVEVQLPAWRPAAGALTAGAPAGSALPPAPPVEPVAEPAARDDGVPLPPVADAAGQAAGPALPESSQVRPPPAPAEPALFPSSGEPVVVVEPPPVAPVAPPEPLSLLPADLPREGEVDYQVSLGKAEGWQLARGTLRWRLEAQRYHIDLTARTVGLARLLKPDPVSQISDGRVTAAGLVPDQFRVLGRTSGPGEEGAQFDWISHRLTFQPSGAGQPLPDGTQDLLSFFLQFAMQPPTADRLEHPVTNGRKLDRYAFELTERGVLQLPLGNMATVHIAKLHAANEDDFEVWLAQDRHYLPVQIRFRAQGRMLTLSATAIRMGGTTGAL